MQIVRLKQRLAHDRISMQPERRHAWLAASGGVGFPSRVIGQGDR
jgi:hypothetical protein